MPPAITVRGEKPFNWTYSKLKNFETCPKRYFETDVLKSVPFQDTEHTLRGKYIHDILAKRLNKGIPLPGGYEYLEPHAARVLAGAGELRVEQKMGFTVDLGPSEFFAPNVWHRGIGDVVKLSMDRTVAHAIDWKNGKIVEDSVQLALIAQCIFANFPTMQAVQTEYVWFQENAVTSQLFTRQDMAALWVTLRPRVAALEAAHKTTTFPANKSGLCKDYCDVYKCPHNGRIDPALIGTQIPQN